MLLNRHRNLRKNVATELHSLGQTPAEVAARLSAAGVSGRPRDPRGCAVAVYLNAVVGADSDVESLAVPGSVVWMRPLRSRIPVCVRLPRSVRAFIAAFDAGAFPELGNRQVRRSRQTAQPAKGQLTPSQQTAQPAKGN